MHSFKQMAVRIAEITSAPRQTWVIQNAAGQLLQIKGRPAQWAEDWYYARTFPSEAAATKWADPMGAKAVPMDLAQCVKPAK